MSSAICLANVGCQRVRRQLQVHQRQLCHLALTRTSMASNCLRRAFSAMSATTSLQLPCLRLPTTIFPGHPLSVVVASESKDRRPMPWNILPALVDEVCCTHSGRVALLADGLNVGVVGHMLELDGLRSAPAEDGMAVHLLGGQRLKLIETLERSPAGGRLAAFEPVDDEPLSVHERRQLEEEAVAARAFISSGGGSENWELLLCHLDEELLFDVEELANPMAHPLWIKAAAVPDDAVDLGFWLACRLPLTTSLRFHLLALPCPLKRLRDVVDALRLLCDPSRADGRQLAKFEVLWHTAEASGCEVEPPRAIIHWRGGGVAPASRY